MAIVDDSTQSEKKSPFYLGNVEVVNTWKSLAEDLNGEISGSVNAYRVELEIKVPFKGLLVKGVKEQYTAQSDTLYSENSHYSELTTLIYKTEWISRTLKVGKPGFLGKTLRFIRKGINSEYLSNGFLLSSDSIETLQKAKESIELQSIIDGLNLISLQVEPRKGLIKFQFNKLFVKEEQFDVVFQLKEEMIKENWC